jgi:hypothetical protein
MLVSFLLNVVVLGKETMPARTPGRQSLRESRRQRRRLTY